MYIVGMSHGSKGKLVHGFGDTRLTISKGVVYSRACMKRVAQNMNYNQKNGYKNYQMFQCMLWVK